MKKSKIWAIANLVMTIVILLLAVFAFTYELSAYKAHVKKLQEAGQDFAGLGAIGFILLMIIALIAYALSVLLLGISSGGLFGTDKKGFLITGAIGKIVMIVGVFFMGTISVSIFARVLYGVLTLTYLTGGILDIVFCKKLKE